MTKQNFYFFIRVSTINNPILLRYNDLLHQLVLFFTAYYYIMNRSAVLESCRYVPYVILEEYILLVHLC